jgi:hypothetical protein
MKLDHTEAELVCRMVEATTGEPRPYGMTATESVHRMLDDSSREFFLKAARVALADYADMGQRHASVH